MKRCSRSLRLLACLAVGSVAGCATSWSPGPPPDPDAGPAGPEAGKQDAGAPPVQPPVDAGEPADAGTDARHSPCDGLPRTTWTVKVSDTGFDPEATLVCPGDTVKWVWEGPGSNSVTSGGWCQPDGIFSSGYHAAPFTYERTFREPAGLFMYYSETDCQNQIGAVLIVR
jgi:plastocyanin